MRTACGSAVPAFVTVMVYVRASPTCREAEPVDVLAIVTSGGPAAAADPINAHDQAATSARTAAIRTPRRARPIGVSIRSLDICLSRDPTGLVRATPSGQRIRPSAFGRIELPGGNHGSREA